HVAPPERAALAEVAAWGLVDTFRARYPQAGLFSYYDYQAGRFHKRQGMRIDFVLASSTLAARSAADLVDRNARKGTKPSDHAPVIAVYRDRVD
ncbi:MAG: exodeoxyribonuclease III, partial [Actinomycetota bacterium]|nr:exodeoxyribonuclease III [Actinomycetota bacterium]